jgi:L,D-peptidoglycan transpeptidase YkuD (ErfK/YbiS/YcfS/YnhG family)
MKRCLAILPVSLWLLGSSPAHATASVRQSVVVEVASPSATDGTLRVVENVGGVDRVLLGPVPTRLGRNGVRDDRREGDGTTPLGQMRIVSAFGLPVSAGAKLPYERVRRGDCWISDVDDPAYNRRVRRARCAAPNEDLYRAARGGAYEFALATSYNTSPIVVGKGSAIFIHVHSYDAAGRTKPTRGCISVSRAVMKRLFTILDPAKDPLLVVRLKLRRGHLGTP